MLHYSLKLSIVCVIFFFFFFNDTATTEIYTLSLHDALPISGRSRASARHWSWWPLRHSARDRKSTRLNSSHEWISYAVFCLKKKKKIHISATDLVRKSKCNRVYFFISIL